MRRQGAACDQLGATELVTADGGRSAFVDRPFGAAALAEGFRWLRRRPRGQRPWVKTAPLSRSAA